MPATSILPSCPPTPPQKLGQNPNPKIKMKRKGLRKRRRRTRTHRPDASACAPARCTRTRTRSANTIIECGHTRCTRYKMYIFHKMKYIYTIYIFHMMKYIDVHFHHAHEPYVTRMSNKVLAICPKPLALLPAAFFPRTCSVPLAALPFLSPRKYRLLYDDHFLPLLTSHFYSLFGLGCFLLCQRPYTNCLHLRESSKAIHELAIIAELVLKG